MGLLQYNPTAVTDRTSFVSKVYTTLAVSLVFCCIGAYFGLSMPRGLFLPVVIVEFILLFACMMLQRAYPINLVLLMLFTTCSGVTLGPVLNMYVAKGLGGLIPQAAGITALTFGGLSAYVHWSKRDFSFLQGFLFMGLLAMVVVGLVSMFFHLPLMGMVYSGAGVLLFSGYILLDTSNLLHRYQDDQYVAATLALYLDLVNMFLYVLRFLSGNRR